MDAGVHGEGWSEWMAVRGGGVSGGGARLSEWKDVCEWVDGCGMGRVGVNVWMRGGLRGLGERSRSREHVHGRWGGIY